MIGIFESYGAIIPPQFCYVSKVFLKKQSENAISLKDRKIKFFFYTAGHIKFYLK